MQAITNKRNDFGVKESANQYRNGGERVLWIDYLNDEITRRIVKEIRAAGFKCWRTGNQIWVRDTECAAINALNISEE